MKDKIRDYVLAGSVILTQVVALFFIILLILACFGVTALDQPLAFLPWLKPAMFTTIIGFALLFLLDRID